MSRVAPTKRIYRSFPKIGRELLFMKTDDENPRFGEGSFLRLKDGSILFAYSSYRGNDYHDDCSASLKGIVSKDEGETWSEPVTLIETPEDALNLMSVSLLRMQNGDLGIFYLKKIIADPELMTDDLAVYQPTEGRPDKVVWTEYDLSRSEDEGKTFLPPVRCIPLNGRFIVNNDRVIRLKDGRIFFAAAKEHGVTHKHEVFVFVSEDDGRTFKNIGQKIVTPFESDGIGLQEPEPFEFEDGTIAIWFRTNMGFQYRSISKDGGYTFTSPEPDFRFTSPLSPMEIRNVGPYTVAVFNPIPPHAANRLPFGMDRTPYMLSVSEDGGITFPRSYLLEDDLKNTYCYPAIIEVEGGFLVAYYHSDNTEQFLNAQKIIRVDFDEIK